MGITNNAQEDQTNKTQKKIKKQNKNKNKNKKNI